MSIVAVSVAEPSGALGPANSVASVARRLCRESHQLPAPQLLGGVACGSCWEEAIRADERVVVEHGLDREPALGAFIDDVAVERALAGESVELTHLEQCEVAFRLHERDTAGALLVDELEDFLDDNRDWHHPLDEPGTASAVSRAVANA